MGWINNFYSLIHGLSTFFGMFRDMFSALPVVVQVLVYFSFSFVLFIAVLRMIRTD